ncbi:hypothetical protein [Curtobacterium sp. MCSS17_016]|uniref:zinc finger domain-containing protein n=1 Tax=Curtobacterium sp. MCSS17_016 TaxID=2175644 RepID=UPI000DAA2F2B|nr:hypothetical protein [Curtobacterium sp. MCSS17_016]WIE81330.1 hypothetical protein DEJ19_019035 [Curtobacterium sp. MCSS17_016]
MPKSTIITCPHCHAPAGTDCTTKAGNLTRMPHQTRWDALRDAFRSRPAVYRLRENDPRFELAAEDLLLCTPYPYDGKQTVLRRLSDGYVPECNQYNANLEFVAFADEYGLEQSVVEGATRYLRQARQDHDWTMRRIFQGVFV